MELLRKHHNSIKRGIISKQSGKVIDVGSGQGGDVNKYSRNAKLSKVLLVEPELREGCSSGRGDVLRQRLEKVADSEKFELVARRMEDLECEETFDHVNIFFCANQMDVSVVVEKLRVLLKKDGLVSGIAMFEEDVVYVDTPSFRLSRQDEVRTIHIPGSYVTNVTERVMPFKMFHEEMSKYFRCKEISKLEEGKGLDDDGVLLNSMYSKFVYMKSCDDVASVSVYLQSFVIPLKKEGHEVELELRSRVGADLFESMKKMIRFEPPFDNSYTYYDLHLYDQRLREYDNGIIDLKSLLFRRGERMYGFSYNVCLSSEVKLDEGIGNKIRKGRVVMRRWVKKMEWGEVSISRKGARGLELEVEFEGVDKLDTARRFIVSIVRQDRVGFNIPTSLSLETDAVALMIKKDYILTKRPVGKRVFIFASRALGIWSWDEEQSIGLLSSHSGNEVVLDAVLRDGRYVVMDVVDDKTTHRERMVAAKVIVGTWNRLYNLQLSLASSLVLTDTDSFDLYVSSKLYSYNSFVI